MQIGMDGNGINTLSPGEVSSWLMTPFHNFGKFVAYKISFVDWRLGGPCLHAERRWN